MPRIIREKYENGALVERHIEGAAFELRRWVHLTIHSIIAISVAVLAVVAVIDSLALHGTMVDEDARPAGCEQPRFRS